MEDKKSFLGRLGPGLITGAADDDPSGIGTYSQVGAQFGYGLSWSLLFSLPFMVVIQDVAAQIGSVTGRGIAANLRSHYARPLLWLAVVLLLLANVINLGADLSAMGAVMEMLLGGPVVAYTLGFGLICLFLEIFLNYRHYAAILKFTTLSLFAYVAVVLTVHLPWGEALRGVLIPHVEWTTAFATGFVAILGTTISPYLFFWQAAQEIEEEKRTHSKPLYVAPRKAGPEMARIRQDTLIGMAFSNIVAVFIVWAAAATLHAHGVTTIETAAEAAEALRPVAGRFAFLLFALGIIGTGLLAVPVLAGSAAYAVAEMLGRPASLDSKPLKARLFYGTIACTTLAGALLQSVGVNPVRALYWSAVVNGVLAAPLMALMMLIVTNPRAMGHLTLGRKGAILGWAATVLMAVATLLFFVSLY
ncbi:NRAMP family divalent metal transporter [Sphingomonas agri]|uniref:NRAMP family divalent metal transporter n=1 Tax=Sphingomonas agri TaxID=1813878 RepID=UPI00311E96E1